MTRYAIAAGFGFLLFLILQSGMGDMIQAKLVCGFVAAYLTMVYLSVFPDDDT